MTHFTVGRVPKKVGTVLVKMNPLLAGNGHLRKTPPRQTLGTTPLKAKTLPPSVSDGVVLSNGSHTPATLTFMPQPTEAKKPSPQDTPASETSVSYLGQDWLVADQTPTPQADPAKSYQQLQNCKESMAKIRAIYSDARDSIWENGRQSAARLSQTRAEISAIMTQGFESNQRYSDLRFQYFVSDIQGPVEED